jgi:hypothetical protein
MREGGGRLVVEGPREPTMEVWRGGVKCSRRGTGSSTCMQQSIPRRDKCSSLKATTAQDVATS